MPPTTASAISSTGQALTSAPRRSAPDSFGPSRAGCRVAAHQPGDDADVERRGEQARYQRRHEQLGDVLLGRDGVDDQDDRRRDQDAQRAADRERAGGQGLVVATAPQLRQCRPAHGRRRRDRRAADRAECGAGADRRHGEPAATFADDRLGGPKQIARKSGPFCQGTHQDEQRDHRERVIGEQIVRRRLQPREECAGVGQKHIADATDGEHGEPDRHPQGHQAEQDGERQAAQRRVAHVSARRMLRKTVSSTTRVSQPASMAAIPIAQPIGRPSTMLRVPLAIVWTAPTAIITAIRPATRA